MRLVNCAIRKTLITLKRSEISYDEYGEAVENKAALINIYVHIQPFNGSNFEISTDGRYQKSVIKLFTEQEILLSDKFIYQDKKFVVSSVADFSLGAIPHFEAVAHEEKQ